ncbi:MAG: hypothetical protein HW421_1835 [Ignavibacteria bacterium]|nr:hypothetical protein [Ignavibacteria bacterium]
MMPGSIPKIDMNFLNKEIFTGEEDYLISRVMKSVAEIGKLESRLTEAQASDSPDKNSIKTRLDSARSELYDARQTFSKKKAEKEPVQNSLSNDVKQSSYFFDRKIMNGIFFDTSKANDYVAQYNMLGVTKNYSSLNMGSKGQIVDATVY